MRGKKENLTLRVMKIWSMDGRVWRGGGGLGSPGLFYFTTLNGGLG